MANELSTKWTYPLTLVSQDKRVPLPGVMEGYAGELTGIDGSVHGGIRPFAGFKKVHELTFDDDPYHDQHSFVTDCFPVNFKIDYDSYAYGFVYRAQRVAAKASTTIEVTGLPARGETIELKSTSGVKKVYRSFDAEDAANFSYSNAGLGRAEVSWEFKQAAPDNSSVTLVSSDGYQRTYKAVADEFVENGTEDENGHVLFRSGGTTLETIPASEEYGEEGVTSDGFSSGMPGYESIGWTLQTGFPVTSEMQSHIPISTGSLGTLHTDPATGTNPTDSLGGFPTDQPLGSEGPPLNSTGEFGTEYSGAVSGNAPNETEFEVTHWVPRDQTAAQATLIMNSGSTSDLNGKTVILKDGETTPNTHTITFDNTKSKSSSGSKATSNITQVQATASTLNGKTVILEDAAGTNHTITYSTSVNQEATGASTTITQATSSASTLNGKTLILEDSAGLAHLFTFSNTVTQANSTESVIGVSDVTTTEGALTSLKKSIDLAITASKIAMTTTFTGGSTLKLTMTAKDATGNGKVISGTAVDGSHVTGSAFAGGATGTTSTVAGIKDSDNTTKFNLESLRKSIELANAAGSIAMSPPGSIVEQQASTTFTFGDTEFNDVNKGNIQLVSTDGTTETYSVRNDYGALGTGAKAEATFTFGDVEFNDVNNAELTLIDSKGVSQTYRIRNDYGATTSKANATFTFGNTEFNDVNFASIDLTDAAGTKKTYRIRNDSGALASGKAAATFTFDPTNFASKNNIQITLIDANGTSKTYIGVNDYSANASIKQFNLGANATAAAANLIALINSANGHNNEITASNSGGVVLLVQDDAGTTGNTTITATSDFNLCCSVAPPDTFSGGGSIEFNSSSNATNAGANFIAAVNGATGHNGTLTATNSSGVITIEQATAGAAGDTVIDVNYNFSFDDCCDVNPPTSFTGGATKEFNAGGNATAAAANFVSLVNASQEIDASNSGGVVTLVQENAGSDGNTTITATSSPSWNDNCDVNAPAAFTRGGFYEINAGANATVAASNFVTAVNTYHAGKIIASNVAGAVTLTQLTHGPSGDTTVTKTGSFDSCLESAAPNFTGGSSCLMRLTMNAVGSAGTGKATTGTAVSGGHTTQVAFAGGAAGSDKNTAGLADSDGTPAFALDALRLAIIRAIDANDIHYRKPTAPFANRMRVQISKPGSIGQGQVVEGTAGGSFSSNTLTLATADVSTLNDKTFTIPVSDGYAVAGPTITFKNTVYPSSSSMTTCGIKGLTTKQSILKALKKSIDKGIKSNGGQNQPFYNIRTTEPGSTTLVLRSAFANTTLNGKTFSGTLISGGHGSDTDFSGGAAGTYMTNTVFMGGRDETPHLEAAAEATSNLREAIESIRGHNSECKATFTFDASGFNDVNNGTITLISTKGVSRTYKIKNDFSAVQTSLEFEAGASATVAATNFVTAVNSRHGHNGEIIASNDGAVVTLLQRDPSVQSAMERAITTGASFDTTTSVNPPAKFALTAVENKRFQVATSTGVNGTQGNDPKIIIVQTTAGNGDKPILFRGGMNSLSYVIPDRATTKLRFQGDGDVMFQIAGNVADTRTNLGSSITSANGHASLLTSLGSTKNTNPSLVVEQVTQGDKGNTLTPSTGVFIVPDFSGGRANDCDIFLDFYHSKCDVWSYGNILRRDIPNSEPMDVASTGRVVVVAVRGKAPTTFYVTEEDCPASSSDATTTSDHCTATASYPPAGSDSCLFDYSLVIETSPGPGIRPDLEGPQLCSTTLENFFDNAEGESVFSGEGTFVTPVPSNENQSADGTVIFCPSLLDEGFYTLNSELLPLNQLDASMIFSRTNAEAISELGLEEFSSVEGVYSDGELLTSAESFLPLPPTDNEDQQVLNVPTEYLDIQEAYDFANDGDTILVGPGIYRPPAPGVQSRCFLTIIPETGNSMGDWFEEGETLTLTNAEGRESKFYLSKGASATSKGVPKIVDRHATARWKFSKAVTKDATITLIGANGVLTTYVAVNTGEASNGEIVAGGIAFQNGSSGSDSAANFVQAVNSQQTTTFIDGVVSSNEVILTQDFIGPTGETSISFTDSNSTGEVTSFAACCNPVPPRTFENGTENLGYQVPIPSTNMLASMLPGYIRDVMQMPKVKAETKIICDGVTGNLGDIFNVKVALKLRQYLPGTGGATPISWTIGSTSTVQIEVTDWGTTTPSVSSSFPEYDDSKPSGYTSNPQVNFLSNRPPNGEKLILSNAWGDNFYFVFDHTSMYSGTKNTSGEYIVGLLDQGDTSVTGQSIEQCTDNLFNLLEDLKLTTKIQPTKETATSIGLTQSIPGGALHALGKPYPSTENLSTEEQGHWDDERAANKLDLPNGDLVVLQTGGGNMSLNPFVGGFTRIPGATLDESQSVNPARVDNFVLGSDGLPITPYNAGAHIISSRLSNGSAHLVGGGAFDAKNVTIRGRYGRDHTILDCMKMPGLRITDTTSPYPEHSSYMYRNYEGFLFFDDRFQNDGTTIEGITFKNNRVSDPSGYPPFMFLETAKPALLLTRHNITVKDCLFRNSSNLAIFNYPGSSSDHSIIDCRFCENVGDTQYGHDNVLHHINSSALEINEDNVFAETCTADVLTDEDEVNPFFDMTHHVFHIGALPGGEFYPGYGNLDTSLCIYNKNSIPEGERVDQLPILKGFIYLFDDAQTDNILFDVRIRKMRDDGEFYDNDWTQIAQGLHLDLDNTSKTYFSEEAEDISWTTQQEVDDENALGGMDTVFRNLTDTPEERFDIEVDRNDLADNIANCQGYTMYLNIAKLWKDPENTTIKSYTWGPGRYQMIWKARAFNVTGAGNSSASKASPLIQWKVEDAYCTYGDDDTAKQVENRSKIEQGDYVFAYELFDSKTGRRSGISEIVQARATDFSDLPTTDPITTEEDETQVKSGYAMIDLVYDATKFDYAYIYRSVNTENAGGTFSAGVLNLDNLIKLDEYLIRGYQPTGEGQTATPYKRAAYVYRLSDLELIYQATYQNESVFDEKMPFGGVVEWYDGTLMMSSINATPVSSSVETLTEGDTLRGLGELRWSSMTERSPEMFSPMNRYVPNVPSNEIINLTKVGSAVVGFSRDRMYHIRKDGGGGMGFLRVLELHEGFGVASSFCSDTVASTIYFLTTKGIKAVDNQGRLDDVRGFDFLITDEWSSTLDNISIAFDPLSSVLFVLNPDKQEACCMWFNTAKTSLLKDMNFSEVRKGPWPSDLNNAASDLVDRALFVQNTPTSGISLDGVTGYRPRVYVYDYNYSKTITNSLSFNGQRRLTMMDGEGDSRFALSAYSGSQPSEKSTIKLNVTGGEKISDEWVGAYLYVIKSATASLVGTKAKITSIANAQVQKYTSGSGDTTITVDGTAFRSLAAGDRVGVSPVYMRWIGHNLGMNSESGEKFAGIDFHRTRHVDGMGLSITDVSGPPTSDSKVDNKYRSLVFSGANLTPIEKVEPKDLNGTTIASLVDGVSTNWAAFGADSNAIALQGSYGLNGPALTPGLEVFCPDLDFRLLSVVVSGKILASDRTSRGTVE